jgi:hypothetical protein
MKTIDLSRERLTLAELLELAKSEPVRIRAADGTDFLLEEADAFDREVATLATSERFMAFLRERSGETKESSAAEVARRLGLRSESVGETGDEGENGSG